MVLVAISIIVLAMVFFAAFYLGCSSTAGGVVLFGVLLFGVWDLCLIELGTACMVAGGIVTVIAFLYGRSCRRVFEDVLGE